MDNWKIYTVEGGTEDDEQIKWPEPPKWRRFSEDSPSSKAAPFRPSPDVVTMVNVAIYLHRPLLVTGKPGSGKSSIAYSVADRLGLELFHWPITTRTTLQDGLYRYDALARLRDSQRGDSIADDIGEYITLGPLGDAFLASQPERPSVLLIDELDKGDIDLPNDLLNIFEEGYFTIPELRRERQGAEGESAKFNIRTSEGESISVPSGPIRCPKFPIVIMTSNEERDFPPAFLRRCLQLKVSPPEEAELLEIVRAHFGDEEFAKYRKQWGALVNQFATSRRETNDNIATDQLLNLIHMTLNGVEPTKEIKAILWKSLSANQ